MQWPHCGGRWGDLSTPGCWAESWQHLWQQPMVGAPEMPGQQDQQSRGRTGAGGHLSLGPTGRERVSLPVVQRLPEAPVLQDGPVIPAMKQPMDKQGHHPCSKQMEPVDLS